MFSCFFYSTIEHSNENLRELKCDRSEQNNQKEGL